MHFTGIIPARYASTRFPGKPLAMIGNKSMIRRVYEQALKARKLSKIIVATDDKRIEEHVREFGNVIMTGSEHKSGTERCGEAAEKLTAEKLLTKDDVIINIQGDEPFINPQQINQLAEILQNPAVQIATLAKKIISTETLFDENSVKVMLNKSSKAICFSRTPLPYCQNTKTAKWLKNNEFYRHIGLYGYKADTLLEIVKLPEVTIEKAESLEQLRWIYNEYDIYVGISQYDNYAVDVEEDIEKIPKNLYV